MAEEVDRYGDLYQTGQLNTLLKRFIDVGLLMKADETKWFATAFKEIKDICDEILKAYNLNLNEIEYM